jgi:DNA-binding GntR family transcriptional regulator
LREGLQELEHRGLITKYENRGTFVTKLTTKEVEEIYAVRLELEPLAAALAYRKMIPEHAVKLGKFLEKMRSARQRQDLAEMLKADLGFHQLIWKLSDNSTLERVLTLVCAPLFAFYLIRLSSRVSSSGLSNDFCKDNEEHYDLLAALNKGGYEEVRKAFREILEVFRARHIAHVEALGDEQESQPPPDTVRIFPMLE